MESLTPVEHEDLAALEQEYEKSLKDSPGQGRVLRQIQDRRLYRDTHRRFEDYCRERWDIGKTHAYGLIQFSITIENLFALADEVSILNERQVRPLAGLQPEQQRQAWQEAKAESGDRPPTGKQIALAAQRFKEPPLEPKFLLVEELHQIREWMERRKESWPEDRRDDFEDSVRRILDNMTAEDAAWRRAE